VQPAAFLSATDTCSRLSLPSLQRLKRLKCVLGLMRVAMHVSCAHMEVCHTASVQAIAVACTIVLVRLQTTIVSESHSPLPLSAPCMNTRHLKKALCSGGPAGTCFSASVSQLRAITLPVLALPGGRDSADGTWFGILALGCACRPFSATHCSGVHHLTQVAACAQHVVVDAPKPMFCALPSRVATFTKACCGAIMHPGHRVPPV
jgi:hypothetical protein